jgi:nitrate/nitrite transport system substrate-binding protein
MVLSLGSPTPDKWQNLASDRGEFNQLKIKCVICGGYHMTADHQRFLSEMPQQPEDLIDDLIKMRLYQPAALNVADTLTQADLRKSLFLENRRTGRSQTGTTSQ